jgi:hypothetical protein
VIYRLLSVAFPLAQVRQRAQVGYSFPLVNLGAVIVFVLLARFARRPILMFKRIAAVTLVLSFMPDVLLLVASEPGATAASVGVLMSMHVVAWAISVGTLTTLAGRGRVKGSR